MNKDIFRLICSYLNFTEYDQEIKLLCNIFEDNEEEYFYIKQQHTSMDCHGNTVTVHEPYRKIEYTSGSVEYYMDGLLHRDYGPAYIDKDIVIYYRHGMIHNDNGYAMLKNTYRNLSTVPRKFNDQGKYWVKNGMIHREYGPAYIYSTMYKKTLKWFLDDKPVKEYNGKDKVIHIFYVSSMNIRIVLRDNFYYRVTDSLMAETGIDINYD